MKRDKSLTRNDDVFRIQFDPVTAWMERILPDDEHIVPRCEKQIHATLRNVDQQTDVDVEEFRLNGEKDGPPSVKRRRFPVAFLLRFGIQTVFGVDRHLPVTLVALSWRAQIVFFALVALERPTRDGSR